MLAINSFLSNRTNCYSIFDSFYDSSKQQQKQQQQENKVNKFTVNKSANQITKMTQKCMSKQNAWVNKAWSWTLLILLSVFNRIVLQTINEKEK